MALKNLISKLVINCEELFTLKNSTNVKIIDCRWYLIKPEKGRTLIWPAEWTHAHCGEIVESNKKYIITGWFEFKTDIE